MKVGQEIQLSIVGADKPITGKIARTAPVIDAESGTLEVQVVVDNPEGKLRSGARCKIQVEDDIDGRNRFASAK